MIEDKLPILHEVIKILYLLIFYLQKAREKNIKVEEIDDEEEENENKSISEFQTLISQAQQNIKNIEKQTTQLIPIKNTIISTTDEEEKEISKKLNPIINNVNDSRQKMNSIIEQLKSQLESGENEEIDEAELRLKKNLFDAMIKKYQHTIQRFQEAENQIKKIKETKLIRGAEIALGEELEEQKRKEIIDNPQKVKQIYEDKLKQKAPVQLINAVRDLEERHQDIKRLEKSVLELHKMILQLNVLVHYQGEMIDNIVENISIAKNAIIKGEKELNGAKNKMNCTRKIKCIIMIVVIAALLIIIIPIIVKFVK